MPYVECQGCQAKFYSAARRINRDACPRCGLELAPAGHLGRAEPRPVESAALRVLRRLRSDREWRSL